MTPTKSTTTAAPPSTAPTAQPLLDLTRLLLAIRRGRRLWICLGVVGLLTGLSLAFLLPTPPTAVMRVYVVHEDDQPSDSGNLARTDVTLMTTAKIAGAALDEVGSSQRPEDFLEDYTVTGLTNNVLEVTVRAETNADAVRRAQALADVFIAAHVSRVQTAAASEAKALTDQRDRVQADLRQVNSQIANAETQARQQTEENGGEEAAQSQPNAAGLDSLYARRAELTSRISDLSQQAEEAGIGAPRVAAGTQVVDAPRPLKISQVTTLATNGAIGLLLGVVLGWVLAALTGVVKDKPVLRKDIAAHLGASVVAQLPMPRRGLARLWRGTRAGRERKRVAGTLARLARGEPGPVSVLELGAPRIAAALVLDVATELASDRDVVIVEDPAGRVVDDDLPGRDLHELTGRADRPIRIIGADQTAPAAPGETRLGVGSVTPGTPWTDLAHLGDEALLVVRTGFANTAWLHAVARQLADCRIPIIGVVLVDPDPRDKSDGTLWDGLHTALRGRTRPDRAIEPAPSAKPSRTPEPAARQTRKPTSALPAHYPTPVPAKGVNGVNGTADLPTKRFASVQPHFDDSAVGTGNGTGSGAGHTSEQAGHDLPTKRFAPVRPEDVDGFVHRGNKS
ncbi:Wzz/FepE/Etk N-terminal domain-containing protein [Actinophytocola sp.]|uniref:Wzz/FepE/Etk N-terminal domain-containing protein n=1 Tax=Actinophytocola sp. TaxID=1872138 RepID=UPI003D6C3B31